MILTYIYTAILALFVVLLLYNLFKENTLREQLTTALVLIPLLLRLLLIK